MNALRRLGQQALRLQLNPQLQAQQPLRRTLADYAKPKVDTSLDHVFGDSSYKLSYNFEPMPMGSLFIRSVIITGVFFFPIWIMLYDDYQYTTFLDKIAAAKAKQQDS